MATPTPTCQSARWSSPASISSGALHSTSPDTVSTPARTTARSRDSRGAKGHGTRCEAGDSIRVGFVTRPASSRAFDLVGALRLVGRPS